ncbi:MAG: hypothetical protein IJ214_10335 [Clostridia bacterium]|nr:hypothetical protein [Clostridia bacterium]
MYIVSKDGSGDFTSLQAAINAVSGSDTPATILIRAGTYKERVIVWRSNLRIVGEDRDSTVITWSACARDPAPDGGERGTFLSFSLIVTGNNVTVENITIRNDAGDGRQVGQAVAVYAAGDRGVWRNCRMIAHQDTLFCGPVMPSVVNETAPYPCAAQCVPQVNEPAHTFGRQYFEGCYIQGDVDYIFGSYRCWFEQCTLFMDRRGGWYTAANTPEDQPYGFVFHRCTLTGNCENGAGYLGRPWRKYCRTVFLRCDMDAHVAPLGFMDWDEKRIVTDRMGEFGTAGETADLSLRHPRQKRLSGEEASQITLKAVLGGQDGWNPTEHAPVWYLCGDSTMADYGPDKWPMMGWGQKLQAQLPAGNIVENCAVNGRSSKSFVDENRLHDIDCCLRSGDVLVVSFGHNDEKNDPRRYTAPQDTFLSYLQMYIDTARRHGAELVLATPIARRHFDEGGKLLSTHGQYPDAMRALAQAAQVRLIDLERATMALFQQMGVEATKDIFCYASPGEKNYPDGCADNSHLQERGAEQIAKLFLGLLKGEISMENTRNNQVEAACQSAALDTLISNEDAVYTRP